MRWLTSLNIRVSSGAAPPAPSAVRHPTVRSRGMRTRQLVAFNTATQSDNKIHDDEVARRFGFSGGLVPGVDVYAYLCWGPVASWGRDWLERGSFEARFRLPTYDGETVTVTFDAAD